MTRTEVATSPAYLDTSFVVRYLTDDPPEMAARAAEVIDGESPLVLSEVILLETAYVLSTVYRISRAEIVESLSDLIQRRNIRLLTLEKPEALEALALCKDSGRHSFVDALLWAQARHAGASRVHTFDRRFPRLPPGG
jgi:predicted nucleic acid-binding protein